MCQEIAWMGRVSSLLTQGKATQNATQMMWLWGFLHSWCYSLNFHLVSHAFWVSHGIHCSGSWCWWLGSLAPGRSSISLIPISAQKFFCTCLLAWCAMLQIWSPKVTQRNFIGKANGFCALSQFLCCQCPDGFDPGLSSQQRPFCQRSWSSCQPGEAQSVRSQNAWPDYWKSIVVPGLVLSRKFISLPELALSWLDTSSVGQGWNSVENFIIVPGLILSHKLYHVPGVVLSWLETSDDKRVHYWARVITQLSWNLKLHHFVLVGIQLIWNLLTWGRRGIVHRLCVLFDKNKIILLA